jgi:hypothetical protein
MEALLQQGLYRERNLVERFFSKLKHFRRIATRYDKLAETSLQWSSSPQYACGSALMSLRPNIRPSYSRAGKKVLLTKLILEICSFVIKARPSAMPGCSIQRHVIHDRKDVPAIVGI